MPTSSSTTRMMAMLGFLLLHQGQADIDPGAALGCIADFYGAQVFFDNFLDDGQAKAGTAGLGGDIGFKDARQQLDRETGAVVGNGQPGTASDLFGADQDTRFGTPLQRVFGVAQ